MDIVVITLAILYLIGYNVGKALAICSIIYAVIVVIGAIIRKTKGE